MEGLSYDLDFDFCIDSEMPPVEEPLSLEVPTEKNLVPKKGCFLGLDISELSSGVTLYDNGAKYQANISVNFPEKSPHREVLARRELKSDLSSFLNKRNFDLILIEDAFSGPNPETTRKLYALNTAIDELILDGEVSCKEFLRVNNQLWKSWLYLIDDSGVTKGFKDKEKIQMCMEMLGVTDSGEGFQDRLDSNGMILGYFLNKARADRKSNARKVSFSDLEFAYVPETDLLNYEYPQTEDRERIFSSEKRWSKEKIISNISDNPDKLIMTDSCIPLSLSIGKCTGCTNFIEGGGYFAFWVKKSKLKKYIKEV